MLASVYINFSEYQSTSPIFYHQVPLPSCDTCSASFCSSDEVGAAAERSNPTSKERRLRGHRRAERSYSTFKVRRGGPEEIPLIQGKRNPSKMVGVARGHQRAHTLKP